MGGLKKGAWKTAVATLMSINLKPRKFGYFQLPSPKRGTDFSTFSTQGVYLFSSHGQICILGSAFWRKLRWMWVAKRWPSSIDSGRTCTLNFFRWKWRSDEHVGIVKKHLFVFIQHRFWSVSIYSVYIYAVVCFRALLVYFGVKISGFYADKVYVFAVASALAKTYHFLIATHWKFEFPLQDASREMKVGIGWDPTLKHMILVVKSQHRWRSFQTPKSNKDILPHVVFKF